jgi:hypothetical protein
MGSTIDNLYLALYNARANIQEIITDLTTEDRGVSKETYNLLYKSYDIINDLSKQCSKIDNRTAE